MYMNKTKRNLILAAAILNLIGISINLVFSIIMILNAELLAGYENFVYLVGYSTNLIYVIFSFAIGLVASILLIYSIRAKGKYFRTSQGVFYTGFAIVIFFGGFLPWILLFIALCTPDVIVMNTRSEVRHEECVEANEMEEKKRKIEELKRLRDEGVITEEEYKQKLFEIL